MTAIDAIIGVENLILVLAVGLIVTWMRLAPDNIQPAGRAGRGGVYSGLLLLCVLALGVTSLLWLWLRTADMAGQSIWAALAFVPEVLLQTHFGAVWWLRIAALTMAGLACARIIRAGSRPRWAPMTVLMSAVALIMATRSATGHASADGDWTLREAMDWLHFVSVSAWGGCLLVAVLLVFPKLRWATPMGRARFARRLSRISSIALAGVLASGIYSTLQMLPSVSDLWVSGYGRLLGIKILLVAGMVALGATNHYRWVPRIVADGTADNSMPARQLRKTVTLEALLLLGVLGVTAVLLGSNPPMS